jgi:L-malate glycosyltransferase
MHKQKILIICPYPEGIAGGQRLKYEQYFESWHEAGFEITISPFFNHAAWRILWQEGHLLSKILYTILGYFKRIGDLFRLRKFDKIYVYMWVTPLFDSVLERLFLLIAPNLIYDFDDSVFLDGTNIKGNFFRKYIKNNNKSQILIKHSSSVITSSPYNLDYCIAMNKLNAGIYIPCSLDQNRFIPFNNFSREKITLGWTGTFTTINYLDSIKHIIENACKQFNLKLVLITNFDYDIDGIDMEVIRWKEDTEIQDLQKIDIGLYPVIPSNWALGKGGLKTLQYMSIGIPSISTNFGTSTKIVTHGKNGFLVNNDQEWLDNIKLLIDDPSLRKNIGINAREHVLRNYSTAAIERLYLGVLNGKISKA